MAVVPLLLLVSVSFVALSEANSASDRMQCPEGWVLQLASCYKWSTSKMTYSAAKSQCDSWGSQLRVTRNEEENNLFRSPSGGTYWLGITKTLDGWGYWDNGIRKKLTYWPSRISENYKHLCLVWASSTRAWTAVQCNYNSYLFICQKGSECISGRFGTNCTEECHCRGQVCNSSTGICASGCQLGWTGTTCSQEKQRAEAKFYCFKIRKQNTLMLRVNQRGTRYRTVTAYNKDGTESSGCNKTHFNHFELGGMATLKVAQQKNKDFTPTCGEQKMSGETVTWTFKFQEFPMTSSAYDVLFEVTCDFKKADTLTRLVTSNSEKPSNKTTTLSETKISVSLDVIDPFTDQALTTVKLGQQVKLQLKLNNGDDFGVIAIAPYNCSVSTLDGVHSVLVKDDNGCTPDDSQIVFNSSDLTKWQSELFETFTFQGYDKINFQCQFHVCFAEEHTFCRDTCVHSKKRKTRKLHRRRRRRKNSEKDEKRKELGTTVNVMT